MKENIQERIAKSMSYINKLLQITDLYSKYMETQYKNNNLLLVAYYGFELVNKILSLSYEMFEDQEVLPFFKGDFKKLHDIVVAMNNNQPYDHEVLINELAILPNKLQKYLKMQEKELEDLIKKL